MLYPKSKSVECADDSEVSGALFAVNNTPGYHRQEVIPVNVGGQTSLRSSAAQISRDGELGYVLVESGKTAETESLAMPKGLYAEVGQVKVQQVGTDTYEMANSSVKMTIHEGRITSLLDVALDKELIPHGQTGGMVIMEDHPNFWYVMLGQSQPENLADAFQGRLGCQCVPPRKADASQIWLSRDPRPWTTPSDSRSDGPAWSKQARGRGEIKHRYMRDRAD